MSTRPLVIAALVALGGGTFATAAGTSCAVSGGHCSHRHLNRGNFTNRNLTFSHWVGTSLERASFRSSDLMGSTFRKANLKFANLSAGDRTKGNYNGANLMGANLTHSTFWGSKMRYANFEYAHLNGTTMDNTDLTGADFQHSDLRGSSFYHAIFCGTKQPDGTVRDDNCPKAGGDGTSGSSVHLPTGFPTRPAPQKNGKSG
jgi:uncharacterized protein YjbI with pentapeptide repeats